MKASDFQPGWAFRSVLAFYYLLIIILPMTGEASTVSLIHIELSDTERHWIDNHSTIRIAGPLNFPPFHIYDENNQTRGIASDYVFLLLSSFGMEVEIVDDLTWPEILESAKNKQLDLISCAAKSSDREKYLLYTEPHLSFPMIIISREDEGFISGLQDLEHKILAMVEKNIVEDWLLEESVNVSQYHYVSSPEEALKAVSVGLADVYVGNLASCTYYINKLGLVNLKVAAPTKFGNYNLHMAVRNDWPELVSILNKGLAAITPEQHSDIRNRWLALRYEHGIRPSDIIRIILSVILVSAILLTFIFLWNRRLVQEIEKRTKKEKELQKALDEINTLTGLLPICSNCKNIRDDKGYWKKIDAYFEDHSDVLFSHGLCPDCARELYGEDILNEKKK